ncbi:DUF4362 domain-containing protein [Planococcus sp. N028]|uniref:DUF4362 domain-containing protein n=2 Tax=Planococcus shixiaomingii TaxID=3058393 RepID=A0ABT8MX92_9BACL|nr:DUF4362 domain-containing protein [Planococcus sp. N028]
MKRAVMLALLAFLIILAGCREEEIAANEKGDVQIGSSTVADDTVVDRHGKLRNEERFTEFLLNVADEKSDQIQIIVFTTEGDPIYRELSFDGVAVKSVMDSTKDQYGSGEIDEMTCKTIKEEESPDRIEYSLEDCDATDGDPIVLVKWK